MYNFFGRLGYKTLLITKELPDTNTIQSVSGKRDVGKQVVGYYMPDRPDLITENRPRKPVFGGFLYFYGAAICLFFGIVTFTGM